jgi:hypothetical protein
MAAAIITAGCEPEDGPESFFIGKWTSAGRMGTIELGDSELGKEVAKAINESVTPLDLTDVVKLDFSRENVTITSGYPGQTYNKKWRYVYRDAYRVLTLVNDGEEGVYDVYTYSDVGECTLIARDGADKNRDITSLVIHALCDHEVRKLGYQSVEESGLTVTNSRLTIRFKKVK